MRLLCAKARSTTQAACLLACSNVALACAFEQPQLACSAFARACASGCYVHEPRAATARVLLLSHVSAPSAATCMRSFEAAMRLLRVDGALDQTSRGSSQALLLNKLVLPAATCTSVLEPAMRLLRAESTLDDASSGSSRALLAHSLARPALTCAQLAAHACLRDFEAAMRLQRVKSMPRARRTTRAAAARVLCSRMWLFLWLRRARATMRRRCACGASGHARQRE